MKGLHKKDVGSNVKSQDPTLVKNSLSSKQQDSNQLHTPHPMPKLPEIQIDVSTNLAVEEIIEVAEKTSISSNGDIALQNPGKGNGELSSTPTPLEKRRYIVKDSFQKLNVSSEEEADHVVNENLDQKDGIMFCKICFFTSKHKGYAKKHIEQKHVRGIIYTCSACNKQYDNKISIYNHQRIHKSDGEE